MWSDERIDRAAFAQRWDYEQVAILLRQMRDEYQARLDDRQVALDQLRIMYRAAVDKAREIGTENEKLKLELKQREGASWW